MLETIIANLCKARADNLKQSIEYARKKVEEKKEDSFWYKEFLLLTFKNELECLLKTELEI